MEVDRVLLEQVGAHDHADVGESEEELVVLIDRHQRRRDISVHHADVHDWPRIHVTIESGRRSRGAGRRFGDFGQSGPRTGVGEGIVGRKDGIGYGVAVTVKVPL